MYNIIFNKELLYFSSRELEVIIVVEAIVLIELLYKPRDIINRGEAEELPINKQDLLLNLSTKQQLRCRAALEPKLTDS